MLFNLRDNMILRNQQSQERIAELNRIKKQQENIKLLISIEVNNNLDILNNYKSTINLLEPNILQKPPCTIFALKSSYDELTSIFTKEELIILIGFYNELENLLDQRNWLIKDNDNSPLFGSYESDKSINIKNIQNNKILISTIVDKILNFEEELCFLDINE